LAEEEQLEPSELSGGMMRRAAWQGSLALDPRSSFMMTHDRIGPVTTDEIARLMRRLQRSKVTSV
jgi:ABC-type transporter Mla maintaining outer membrane lipid asymmetry ATPase subunit MlaF